MRKNNANKRSVLPKGTYAKFVGSRQSPITKEQRHYMAKAGIALPDGSFLIANQNDLANAIVSHGLSKNKRIAKQHIIRPAKQLKLVSMLPKNWKI